jgi:chitosanase
VAARGGGPRTAAGTVRRVRRRVPILCAALLAALVPAGAAPAAPVPVLTPQQRAVADQLVSVFENSTTTIRYGYVVDLHDGCGFTAGRAGFCSATGDMLKVVEDYATRKPGNRLARFLPVLRRRAATGSASTRRLGRPFAAAWRRSATDPAFRRAQDDVVDALYFDPAARMAGDVGLRWPLAVAIFYDTAIEHGTSRDPDGLPSLIARTRHRGGGLPQHGADPTRWLLAFLAVRRADLLHPHNRDRRVDWPESVGRVSALRRLLVDGHTQLDPPLTVDPWGDHAFVLDG